MIVSACPMTDSRPHDVFSSACECGVEVEFVENGNMVIKHHPYDIDCVEKWGVFEEEEPQAKSL